MTKWKYFEKAEFIHNGTQSDPELRYKDFTFNYYTIEDTIYERFKEFCEEENIVNNEENFTEYCNNNQDDIEELFEDNVTYALEGYKQYRNNIIKKLEETNNFENESKTVSREVLKELEKVEELLEKYDML